MNRRAFLASALAATAGCAGRAGTRTTEPPRTTHTDGDPTDGTTDGRTEILDGERTVSVESVSQGNLGDAGLTATVSVPRESITSDHTARVRLRLVADAETTLTNTVCWPGNIHRGRRAGDDTPLLLWRGAPPEWLEDCWTIPPENLHLGRACTDESVTIAPEKPLVRTFSLCNHPENDDCFPVGRYRVEDGFSLNEETTLTWSFDLRVES